MQPTVAGAEPEQVIVLETMAKSVDGVAKAAARIPGLEWLAERDLEEADASDGFADVAHPEKKLSRRLYALFSNQNAMQQLLALWQRWVARPAERARRNFGPFKELFVHLKDVRRWGVRDRLAETGVLEYWEENLTLGIQAVLSEVELWPHQDAERRARAYEQLSALVQQSGGRCVAQTAMPEILYHGVLVELPSAVVRDTLDRLLQQADTQLIRCDEVMFFRGVAQSRLVRPVGVAGAPLRDRLRDAAAAVGDPVVGLLDGLPLAQHVALAGRIVIDDPENVSQRYRPEHQRHGTAMASLIVHGDLGREEPPLARPVYVRPLYQPFTDLNGNLSYEGTSPTCLLVDLFHRAVKRIKEGEGDQAAVAPTVQIINLSFGDLFQPFANNVSPLARLLDWLAWKYNVLFLISCGNQPQDLVIDMAEREWRRLEPGQRAERALQAMHRDQALRRMLSPGEAINAVTVGSVHADESGGLQETDVLLDLLGGARLPSPFGTVAHGFKRAIKPEVLLPGGRQLYRVSGGRGNSVHFRSVVVPPIGAIAAAPGQRALELDRVEPSCGSSVSTALGSRIAHLIFDRSQEGRNEPGGDRLEDRFIPVILKTLLVHGASWGRAGDEIERIFAALDWRTRSRLQGRFLGYGEISIDRCLFATDQRVLLLGWDEIGDEEGHIYEMPLPPSLSASRIRRRLTVSLGWFTPINPRHMDYRKASLWFQVPEAALGVEKKDADFDSTKRGTLQHRVMEGEDAKVFVDGDKLRITVSCKEDAGLLTERIPYAVAVTLEVAEAAQVNLYEEVRTRIRPEVAIAPRA
ncbi:MAG TPA: S8 family peptidase [Candidatus Acidoferrum sp.]|nr:S8 family peptidase [Candidatus Acidoferrum sp.]